MARTLTFAKQNLAINQLKVNLIKPCHYRLVPLGRVSHNTVDKMNLKFFFSVRTVENTSLDPFIYSVTSLDVNSDFLCHICTCTEFKVRKNSVKLFHQPKKFPLFPPVIVIIRRHGCFRMAGLLPKPEPPHTVSPVILFSLADTVMARLQFKVIRSLYCSLYTVHNFPSCNRES